MPVLFGQMTLRTSELLPLCRLCPPILLCFALVLVCDKQHTDSQRAIVPRKCRLQNIKTRCGVMVKCKKNNRDKLFFVNVNNLLRLRIYTMSRSLVISSLGMRHSVNLLNIKSEREHILTEREREGERERE